jgi:hypothetical protein
MSISSQLRELRLKFPTPADIEELRQQINAENNDRGAAILASTLVHNALYHALTERLSLNYSSRAAVFDNYGPLRRLIPLSQVGQYV